MAIIVWRTDTQFFDPGGEMLPRGDHKATLDNSHKGTENLLRAKMKNGYDVRVNSLYTWRDEVWARTTWKLERKTRKYLYRLKIEETDVRHTGDLCYYTEIGEALSAKTCPKAAIKAYASGAAFIQEKHNKPRVEILVRKATVLDRYDPPPK